ncbi:uncharacterized protein LOC127721136 [Mytilus californianus]|uniref:uncharacterized protein LOC127721136 n=1 Tax=Mytilus californianus TaxID=6549 RepID=UPI0022453AEE|nr:uncharacterized protein LOC127721136 [Mytilus californianus]
MFIISLFFSVVLPVDGRSTESHVFKPVNDRRTTSHGGIPVDDRSTKSHGGYSIPGHDRNVKSNGIPTYAFIVGGRVGVLLIICIIVGVVVLRRRNCSDWRNAQRTNKNKVITKLNPTCDITKRQREPENYEQSYFMNSPDAIYLATSHDINLDNRTDDNLHSHDVKLCHAQKRSILTNDGVIKEDSTTYSHLRNTMDDSDVMYDHTVHNTVHDTCDGDYGVIRIRITDDDYDVSGNYRQSLNNKTDPVYN